MGSSEFVNKGIISLEDPLRNSIENGALWSFAVLVIFSFAFFPHKVAAGVAIGGLLSFLSFRDLRKTLEKFFALMLLQGNHGGGFFVGRHYLKLTLLFVGIGAVLKSGQVEILGLVVGLSLMPAILVYTGISLYIRNDGGRI